jgi:hypothetical protein
MIRNKLAALKKKEKEVGITKLELYLKMRENGIVDDPSGIEKLEDFKKKLRERQNKQFGTMVKVKMKDLKLKDNLKTLLDQRRVQLGVESSFIDDEHPERLIYPLNEYEKIRGKFEANKDLVQIDLVRLEDLEKVDSEAIAERLTKCRKVIRMVFNQYSNCLKGFDKGADFERIKSQLNRLSRMEFWKFIKDFALTNFITPEEVATIYKEINVKFMHNTVDLNYLGYPAMKHLFFQTACFMFSRPPIDLSHLPPAYAFDKLIELIIKKLKDSGHETKFFDEPDKYNLFGDPEVHDFLNQKLAEDPDYQLPTVSPIDSEIHPNSGEEGVLHS